MNTKTQNEFWNARREHLEKLLRKTALDLFEHTGSAGFRIDLDPPHDVLVLECNMSDDPSMIPDKEPSP